MAPKAPQQYSNDKPPELYLAALEATTDNGRLISFADRTQYLRRSRPSPDLLTNCPDGVDPKRSMAMLDGLASLCVYQEREQVVALSLTTEDTGKMTVHVAQNGYVDSKVELHLKEIWGSLQMISRAPPKLSVNPTGSDLPVDPALVTVDVNKTDLLHIAHKFGWKKFHRRVLKASLALKNFLAWLEAAEAGSEKRAETRDARLLILNINSLVAVVGESARVPGDPTCRAIVGVLEKLWKKWYWTLDEPTSLLGQWESGYISSISKGSSRSGSQSSEASNPETSPTDNFFIRRYLSKVLCLYNHVQTLILFAQSEAGQRNLRSPLDVVRIPNNPRSRPISIEDADLQDLVTSLEGAALLPESGKFAGRIGEGLRALQKSKLASQGREDHRSVVASPHAECRLLAFHHLKSKRSGIYPFNYFGVNKLKCRACDAYFTAYAVFEKPYYTRGAHSKFYFPWTCPILEGENADIDLEVQGFMVESCVKRDLLGSLTDLDRAAGSDESTIATRNSQTKPARPADISAQADAFDFDDESLASRVLLKVAGLE